MRLSLLRTLDRWIGTSLLYVFVLPVHIVRAFLSSRRTDKPHHVFLKLKGGGSLIIAMPSLLGLRRQYPDAEFTLVCAAEAKIYAELTGIFNNYIVIDDRSLPTLVASGIRALRSCFRSEYCIDLEPNSWLAALFTLVSCAVQRIGFVKPEYPARSLAYTSAISFNAAAPIYIYYDQISEMLGAKPASTTDCRECLQGLLPEPLLQKTGNKTISLAPFTSDFARERMMPAQTWAQLLHHAYGSDPCTFLIFGSARNKEGAGKLIKALEMALPSATFKNMVDLGSLGQVTAQFGLCDEVWAVDSGLLHIARLMGIPCRSYWGPTMPSQRLRPISGLSEQIYYRPFLCSPCVQAASVPPCGGNNLCMITMAEESPDLRPSWVKEQ